MKKKSAILSKQIVGKLDSALTKGNIDDLKKQMEKLFGYKDIFSLHDEHLTELAECIVDLAESDNRKQDAMEMELYAKRRIFRYQEKKRKLIRDSQWAKTKSNKDELLKLDLSYQVWTYNAGFEYSKFHMYSLMCRMIHTILASEKAGAK